jgi:hypothetical protein
MLMDRGSAIRSPRLSSPEDSLLCRAAKSGHVDISRELLARGASLLQRDEKSWQPLRCAAYYGHVEIVEILLAAGARVSNSDSGDGSLQIASSFGFANAVNAERRRAISNLLMQAVEGEGRILTRLSDEGGRLRPANVRSSESFYSELPSLESYVEDRANVHPPEGFYAVVGTRKRHVSELPSRERDVKEWLEAKSNSSRGPSDCSTELSGGDMSVVSELPAESITPDFVSDGTPSSGPRVLDDPMSLAGGERGRNGDNAVRTTVRRPLTVVHEVEVDSEEGNESERTPALPLAEVQDGEEEKTTADAS